MSAILLNKNHIQPDNGEGLNLSAQTPWRNVFFKADPDESVVTDCDEEAIFNIKFAVGCRLTKLVLKIGKRSAQKGNFPSELRYLFNVNPVSFEDAELRNWKILDIPSYKEDTEVDLFADPTAKNVTHMSIFIPGNRGEFDVTEVGTIQLWGVPSATLKMGDWNPKKG